MAQRAIRFSEATDRGIHEATEKRGFSSPTAFIRHAVEQELAATPAIARNVLFNIDEGLRLFPRAIWGVTATGRDMFKIVTLGLALGCDLVRVGLEDSIHLPDGRVARDNTEMVRAAIQIAAIYGLKPATVAEVRARFRI